ncbi:MAG TPA: efflux RND transporter permease subunit, partial [Candidatus Absconditabacterales bacterium]|nr:efflux RND transporter permease subunit [Candidatus Absconditabacterales bacterium]
KSLAGNARQSVLLIFLIMWLFVGLKQSMIATFAMPLAFFITFIFLNNYGYTLNFLTNFSLVLSFGMGIDTVVVIIEAAYELMKKGFNSKTAVLLALKQYGKPNITSSLANMVVFLPMLALPGITGKFLAYIPITIFCTLAASLFLASSINNALFWKINNNQKWYYKEKKYQEGEEDEDILLSPEDVLLLEQERQGKEARDPESQPRIDQNINGIAHRYSNKLHRILERRFWRRWTYRGPVVGLILSFIFLSGSIGFKLFPSGDNEFMDIEVKTLVGTRVQGMVGLLPQIDQIISHIPEVRNYSLQARNNVIDIGIRLVKKNQRTRNSFTIQDDIDTQLSYLKTQGYTVQSKVQAGGPPVGKAVGIELIAENSNQLSQLKQVANQIETYIKSLTGTINVANSSQTNPGQFVFTRDKTKLAELGLTPNDIQGEIRPALIGQNAGTLSIDGKERDIVVQYEGFDQAINPETILSTVVNTKQGPIMIGSVMTYSIDQSLNSVSRKDGELTIIVDADLKQGLKPTDFQPKLIQYAQSYQFPTGIGFKAGGENEANKELIQAAGVAFIIAIFLTFLILIYQFNSFKQSVMILYSIITALLGVNIGLRLTGNPYSMPFMIGFISLIGIVVNNAIFIIDKINNNLTLGAGLVEAIVDAGKTRFKPVIISSLTTIFGIITLAWKDEFWAGLAYTVVFGLLFSSFMTLIAIPNIYYAVYKKRLITTNNNESLSDNK